MIQIIEDEWLKLSIWFIEDLLKVNDSDYPYDLLKMNDSDYWRWMIKIIEGKWLRLSIWFIENEWFRLLKIYWRWMI
jgi:hypothetical protein